MRIAVAVALVTALAGCAPSSRYVREGAQTLPLERGFIQGPMKTTVPLDDAFPTRVSVRVNARCAPEFRASLAGTELRRLRSTNKRVLAAAAEWQALLKERAEGERAAASSGPSAPAGSIDASAAVTSGSVSAHATVQLPGHWQQVSGTSAFDRAASSHCASVTESIYVSSSFPPGTRAVELALWSDWPQLVEDGSVSIEVGRLEPPPEPAPSSPPAPGAVRQPGHYVWNQAQASWRWEPDHWLRPEGAPPPPKDDRPWMDLGRPPDAGAQWETGHWSWSDGWVWERGRWRSGSTPPPSRDDRPWLDAGRPGPEAHWVNGHWALADGVWEWQDGFWSGGPPQAGGSVTFGFSSEGGFSMTRERHDASAASPAGASASTSASTTGSVQRVCSQGPPPEAQVDPRPPQPPGTVWIGGYWRKVDCVWAWQPGRWETPPGPDYVWVPGPTIDVQGHWVVQTKR